MCFPRVSTSSAITPYLSHVAVLDTQRVHEVLSLLAVLVNDMFVSWGRQVEVRMRDDDPKGPTRKINPTDLVALSEEPKQAVDDSGGDSLGVENLKLARENESYDALEFENE